MSEPNGVIKAERLVTIAACTLAVIGGLWGFAIKPVDGRVGTLEVRGDKRDAQTEQNRLDIVALREQLKEVETQFRMSAAIANVRHERDWILTQILGEQCGIRVPSAVVHPEVAK